MTTDISTKNETSDVALHGTEISFYCSVNNENKWKDLFRQIFLQAVRSKYWVIFI